MSPNIPKRSTLLLDVSVISFVLSVYLAAVAPSEAPAAAPTIPTLETIRANIKRTVGTKPKMERKVVVFDRHNVHGRKTTFRSGEDYRTVYEEGPFTTQDGELAKQEWHQNENGETVLDQPDPGNAIPGFG